MSNEENGKCPQKEMKELIGAIRSHNDEIDKLLLDLSAKTESCGRKRKLNRNGKLKLAA